MVDSWLPYRYRDVIRAQAREVDRILSAWVRGQALCCLLLALYYAAGLTVAGLDLGLIVGLMAGLLSFIPYVGSITGGLTAIGLALAQFPHWRGVAVVGGVLVVGQILEGYVIYPRFLGDRVELPAVWVIFALFAGGAAFGFLGVMLAVPVAATIGVLARFWLRRYLASPLYLDPPSGLMPHRRLQLPLPFPHEPQLRRAATSSPPARTRRRWPGSTPTGRTGGWRCWAGRLRQVASAAHLGARTGAALLAGPTLTRPGRPAAARGPGAGRRRHGRATRRCCSPAEHRARPRPRLLLSGRTAPARWPVRLPDLSSRLRAITAVEIRPPGRRAAARAADAAGRRPAAGGEPAGAGLAAAPPAALPAALREAVARLDRASLASGVADHPAARGQGAGRGCRFRRHGADEDSMSRTLTPRPRPAASCRIRHHLAKRTAPMVLKAEAADADRSASGDSTRTGGKARRGKERPVRQNRRRAASRTDR